MIDVKFFNGTCTRVIFHMIRAFNFLAEVLAESGGFLLEVTFSVGDLHADHPLFLFLTASDAEEKGE